MMDCCRICLARNAAMKDIFDAEPDSIIDRIMFCTGIQFTKQEDLPTQICDTCLENLSIAHRFKTLCLTADETFRKIYSRIKTEAVDNDDDYYDNLIHVCGHNEENGETKVKEEIEVLKQNNIRKSGRIKKEKIESPIESGKKRRPYNKTGVPTRLRKQKFSRLKCEACNIKFANKEESNEHKKIVHKGNKNWICEICGKVFVHQGSHYTHMRSHLPPEFGCEQCDYKTQHKHDLVKHIRIHSGLKLFQCEFCTTSYHTSSNLISHIRRLHEGRKRFQCHLCDRKFYDRTKLNRHVDSHNDIKRFECEVCHSCFSRRCYWKKHMQKQHGVLVPAQRPGRQRVNFLIGDLVDTSASESGAMKCDPVDSVGVS